MGKLSKNEVILVLIDVVTSVAITTSTNAVASIANGALSSGTKKLPRGRCSIPEAAVC